MKRLLSGLSLSFLLMVLAACSREPSGADIEAAMKRSMDSMKNSPAGKMFGDDMKVYSVKKLGCEKAESGNAYVCDIETDAEMPLQGRGKFPGRLRLVRGDDGWVITGNQ